MAVNRSAVITKLHKVLKKHYQPVEPAASRTLLENLLFACCLENAPNAAAEAAFQAVSSAFFDWNEVRVTTVKELAEILRVLPNPQSAANNLRRSLQALFEANYSFDLEPMKKLNLGQAVQKLSSYDGVSPFAVSYVTQYALGGHSIPLDAGAMGVLAVIGLVPENAAPKDGCPGLERAIPKNKGLEFGSLLHQISSDFTANPFSTNLHKVLLEVDPDAKARLPKRQSKVDKKSEDAPAEPSAKSAAKADATANAKTKPAEEKKPEAAKPSASKGEGGKSGAAKGESGKTDASKIAEKKPSDGGTKKPAAPAAANSAAKKPSASAASAKKPAAAAKKSAPAKTPPTLAKRKPR